MFLLALLYNGVVRQNTMQVCNTGLCRVVSQIFCSNKFETMLIYYSLDSVNSSFNRNNLSYT